MSGLIPSIDEYEDVGGFLVLNKLYERPCFVGFGRVPETLVDGVDGDLLRLGHDVHGVDSPLICQIHDIVIERGAEKECLAITFLGCLINDATNVGDKPHIKHPVGFVNDQYFDFAQADHSPVAEIDQSSGRCDENVDGTFLELLLLPIEIHSSHHGDHVGIHVTR